MQYSLQLNLYRKKPTNQWAINENSWFDCVSIDTIQVTQTYAHGRRDHLWSIGQSSFNRMALSDHIDQINRHSFQFFQSTNNNNNDKNIENKQIARSNSLHESIYIITCVTSFSCGYTPSIQRHLENVSVCWECVFGWLGRIPSLFFLLTLASSFKCNSFCVLWYCMNRSMVQFLLSLKAWRVLYGFGLKMLFNHVDCVWFFSLRIFSFLLVFLSFYSRLLRAALYYTTHCIHIIASSFFFRLCHACTRSFGAFNTHSNNNKQRKTFTFHCSSYHISLQYSILDFIIKAPPVMCGVCAEHSKFSPV